ncbi:MAG: M20/M25/M40 family metallo-hydrolase, partial [Clostridiales bacterium]|nr:M20/M25/M40 family metallo-hydrolase [Clostridiales bacterium]
KNVEFDYVLDEGGTIVDGKLLTIKGDIALSGTCEKGYMDVTLTCKKAGGHASTPDKPTALASVCKAVYRVEKQQMRPLWTPPVKELVKELAPHMPAIFKYVMVNRDIFSPLIKLVLPMIHPIGGALTKTTFAPTMAKGSGAANVLPPCAEAVINCRLITGNSVDDVLNHVKKVAGRGIDVGVIDSGVPASLISPTDTDAYKNLVSVIKSALPGAVVAPYMFIAATDSRYYYPICKNVYRFTPFAFSEDDQSRVHALNERCNIDALKNAAEFFIALIEKTCV